MADPETNGGTRRVHAHTMIWLSEPLNGTNWVVWREAMRCVLRLGGVEEHVYGKIKRPENAQDAKHWVDDDNFAQLVIMNNISDPEIIHIVRCKTANAMWLSLEAEHDPESIMHRFSITDVGRSLFHTTAEDGADFDDFDEHLLKLKVYWERFNSMTDGDLEISDALFKIIIAASLPPSWDTFTEPYIGSSEGASGTAERNLSSS